jgi:hypothetical protein
VLILLYFSLSFLAMGETLNDIPPNGQDLLS